MNERSDNTNSLRIGETTITLVEGDITSQDVDAIVNAANSGLIGGGGVDGAIHRAAGPTLKDACQIIVEREGRLPAGQAVMTDGGRLSARVIHTVGPRYRGRPMDRDTLASCYRNCLCLARDASLRRVAFPSISTGAYRYPIEEAAPIAMETVAHFLGQPTEHQLAEVRFVLFDHRTFLAYQQAMERIRP